MPNTTQKHIQLVAQSLEPHHLAAATAATTSPAASLLRPEAPPVALPEAANAVVDVAGSVFDPRAARIRQLILENRTSREIIGEVWGTAGGDSYRKASVEYQAVVRQLIR